MTRAVRRKPSTDEPEIVTGKAPASATLDRGLRVSHTVRDDFPILDQEVHGKPLVLPGQRRQRTKAPLRDRGAARVLRDFLWEIPGYKIYGHFQNIETLLQKVNDIDNLKFSFEGKKEVTYYKNVSLKKKEIGRETIRTILDRYGLYDINVPNLFICPVCSGEKDSILKSDVSLPGYTGNICLSCKDTYYNYCSSCGNGALIHEMKIYAHKYYCKTCASEQLATCSYCGDYHEKSSSHIINYKGKDFTYCTSQSSQRSQRILCFCSTGRCRSGNPSPVKGEGTT